MKRVLSLYFGSWWLPAFVYMCTLLGFTFATVFDISTSSRWQVVAMVSSALLYLAGVAFLGIIFAAVWNLIQNRLHVGIINTLLILVCGVATIVCVYFLAFVSFFGPSEDGFADNLTIPEGIEIAEPDRECGRISEIDPPGSGCSWRRRNTIHAEHAVTSQGGHRSHSNVPRLHRRFPGLACVCRAGKSLCDQTLE